MNCKSELAQRPSSRQDADDTIIDSLPGNRTDYTHRGVRGGVNYFYRVRAINAAGMGGWSDASPPGTTPTAAQGTPDAPTLDGTGFLCSAGSTVTFSWTPPANNGTLPITGYVVQYQRDDDDSDSDFSDATRCHDLFTGNDYVQAQECRRRCYQYQRRPSQLLVGIPCSSCKWQWWRHLD